MIRTDYCSSDSDFSQRRLTYQKRKLNMLNVIRDGLERRISAIDASIVTLKSQIERLESPSQ